MDTVVAHAPSPALSLPHDRVFNFSAGPSSLPVEVLDQIAADLYNYKGAGMGVMEMSHRGKVFERILGEAEADLRSVFNVPNNYKILFLQGGASLQNSMIPLAFLRDGLTADYVVTGYWGKNSEKAARVVGSVHTAYDGKDTNYDRCPDLQTLQYSDNSAYMHFVSNETISGIDFFVDPTLPMPVICDMSSNILSRPVDISKYAMIYAGAQKTMGPSGTTIVIIRDDMIERVPKPWHPMLDYRLIAENGSMFNTPPCFAIYVCGLVYKWVIAQGGTQEMARRNEAKAKLIYDAIDSSSGFYTAHAHDKKNRSLMNITFKLPTDELTEKFVKDAQSHKLDGLKGHRSLGGIRASTYNAFPPAGCQVLAEFMRDFASKNG